jgi:hypothetical protein
VIINNTDKITKLYKQDDENKFVMFIDETHMYNSKKKSKIARTESRFFNIPITIL